MDYLTNELTQYTARSEDWHNPGANLFFLEIFCGILAKSIYFHLTLTPSPFPSPERVSGEGKGCPAGTGMG
jgi:hypothetical protein